MKKYLIEGKKEDNLEIKSSNINDKNKKANTSAEKKPQKKRSAWKTFFILLLGFGSIGIIISIIAYNMSPTSITNVKKLEVSEDSIIITTTSNQPIEIPFTANSRVSITTNGIFENIKVSIDVATFGRGYVLYGERKNIGNEQTVFQFGDTRIYNSNGAIQQGINGEIIESDSPFSIKMTSIASTISAEPIPISFWAILFNLSPLLIYIIIIIVIYRFYAKSSGSSGSSSLFSVGKSGAKLVKSDVKFTDVAGISEEKTELLELVDYLKNPAKYVAMGARSPKGVVLYGPPGTGKTLLAKAVAGEANVPFFFMSGSGFEDMLVGVGAKRVRDLFKKASEAAPAIIFIDEIDSVASKRSKFDVSSGIGDQTINQLLAEMDGFTTNSGVVVIAATNRLDQLDDAILRPGRFDRQVQINLPDIKERIEILKIHAKNKNISSIVDLGDIARRTPGFSGAQLENVLNEAAILAVRENKNVISLKMIDEAVDRVIAGPAKRSRVISQDERKLIAYHEAGHALVGLYTSGADVVEKITIIPRGRAAGYTVSTPKTQELSIQKKSDLLDIIRMTLGGRAAEETIYGKMGITTGASNDLYKVTNIVRAMVMQMGMSSNLGMTQFIPSEGVDARTGFKKLYSNETSLKIDAEIDHIINTEYQKALKIIQDNRSELELIVETLLAIETITKAEIDFIHKYKKLPDLVIQERNKLNKKIPPKN